MKYEEALEAIKLKEYTDSRVGLVNITKLLEESGNPQNKLKIIHVAGTNGKGSICNYLQNMLMAAGYSVGLYTSPSLKEFNERIRIDHDDISDEDLLDLTRRLNSQLTQTKATPSFFEWITTLAFHYFYEKQPDFVILEVGLGGRLDATNVIEAPLISIISPIGLDHQEYLGDSLGAIAGEKAGIIKANIPVVLYPGQSSEVSDVIEAKAKEMNASLILPNMQQFKIISVKADEQVFAYKGLHSLKMHTIGVNQFHNAVVAVEAILTLRDRDEIDIADEHIKEGIEQSKWPGRFEKMLDKPTFIVDGAHNSEGVASLKENIETYYPHAKVTAIIGALNDKNFSEMIQLIDPVVDHYYVVSPKNKRTLSIAEMKAQMNHVTQKEIRALSSLEESVHEAMNTASPESVIVCFGSLYLVSECREIILEMTY